MTAPLVLACGALASDLRAVLDQLGVQSEVEVRYLPAPLHNRPERIVPAIEEQLRDIGDRPVLLGYADCGTGGHLDAFLERSAEQGVTVTRLPGSHCYEFFAGAERFAEMHEAEPGTFYLTDFLAKHFDALIWQGLGLDRHPQLLETYFGNYVRVVLISQSEDETVVESARRAARLLGLEFEHAHVGRVHFADAVAVGLPRRIR